MIEASFSHDYKIILNKKTLEKIKVEQFFNLISNFSSESPFGKVEELISTNNKNLNISQIRLKNSYIFNRNKGQKLDGRNGLW